MISSWVDIPNLIDQSTASTAADFLFGNLAAQNFAGVKSKHQIETETKRFKRFLYFHEIQHFELVLIQGM